jgi:hypothetical protein
MIDERKSGSRVSDVHDVIPAQAGLPGLDERLLANGDRWEREIAQNLRLDAPYR